MPAAYELFDNRESDKSMTFLEKSMHKEPVLVCFFMDWRHFLVLFLVLEMVLVQAYVENIKDESTCIYLSLGDKIVIFITLGGTANNPTIQQGVIHKNPSYPRMCS